MSKYAEIAKEILNANSIKCLPGSVNRKGPVIRKWSKYSKVKPGLKTFKMWTKNYPYHNLCIPLGKTTNIICVDIDIDEKENPELYKKVIDLLPTTPIKKFGSKGISAFYTFNGEKKKQFFLASGSVAVEILSTGNTTDIPPSIHSGTKKPYIYVGEKKFTDQGVIETLPKLPESFIKKLGELFPIANLKTNNSVGGRANKLKQMTISALNSGKDIKRVAAEVFEYDVSNHNPRYFSDVGEFGEEGKRPKRMALKFVKSINKTLDKKGSFKGIKVLTLDDVESLGKVEQKWLVCNLLPEVGTSLLVGPPKRGKSQLCRYLIKCVLDGEPFLGRKVVKGSAVLGLFEERPQNVLPFLKKVGIQRSNKLKIVVAEPGMNPFLSLTKFIQSEKPSIVIIDTLQTFARINNINDYSEVTPVLNKLGEIAHDSGIHILMVHHSKKGGDGSTDSVLGSQGLFGGVDTLMQIHMQQGSTQSFFTTTQRYSSSDFKSAVLFRNKDLSWKSFRSLDDFSTYKLSKKIISTLKDHKSTEAEIIKKVGGKTKTIKSSLRLLFDRGKIEREGEGKRGKPFVYKLKGRGNKELQKK